MKVTEKERIMLVNALTEYEEKYSLVRDTAWQVSINNLLDKLSIQEVEEDEIKRNE